MVKLDNYEQFKEHIAEARDAFRRIGCKKPIRLISHLDCDGICSCALLVHALNRAGFTYNISIVQQLDEAAISQILREKYSLFFFTDIGSGHLPLIKKYASGKQAFILDHHEIEGCSHGSEIIHINPHLFSIDGSREISGSGVVYLFARELDKINAEMAHIAVIGAIGDVQENNGFLRLNEEIAAVAEQTGKIKRSRGLRIFGSQTRPIHKALEYSTDPFIPGVSGSESGAIQFLMQLGVNPKEGGRWRKLYELSREEMKRLVAGVVLKRVGEENPEDVLGYIYILPHEKAESPLRDAKEFATLLNACGRMNKASYGIGACLNDPKMKKLAVKSLTEYRKEIIKALNWYNSNPEGVIKEKGFVIINAHDNIPSTIIGTLASIISKSNSLKPGTIIVSLAQMLDSNTKVSFRIAGNGNNGNDENLKELSESIAACVNGNAGGHRDAAGAVIPTEREEDFVNAARKVLKARVIEERVREPEDKA